MNNLGNKFDFDDILIVPNVKTHIKSRYKDIILPDKLPLITAPMDTVVNLNNMDNFINAGINVALPRTVKYSDFEFYQVLNKKTDDCGVFISVGFEDLDISYNTNFKEYHKNAKILIDVANGHMMKIIDYSRELKRLRPDIKIMVGNIGNPKTYELYAEYNCVDYIRVGIGNGNACLTTKQSGVGFPMASLISEIYTIKVNLANSKNNLPAIVADGGMKDYSDVIKAIALGADYVMIGSIFNKSFESAADNYLYGVKINNIIAEFLFDKGFPIKKYFRGMSTKEAQTAMGKSQLKTSEGVTRFRKVEYHLDSWVENFKHYLRTDMSYSNAKSLEEFIGKVNICQITNKSYERFNK